MEKTLKGKIALVAGATRGAGRGMACMLGEAGATVYCTGRSVKGKPPTMKNRPETIEETAEMVTERGGHGIAVQVDHTKEDQVEALFKKVKKEQGKLNILINDIWGGDDLTEWSKSFWELDLKKGFTILERAVNAHLITSKYGVPLMLNQNEGIVFEITDGDAEMNKHYRGTMFYDLAKVIPIRLAYNMSQELRDTGITAVALSPGFLRSEYMLDHFGVTEENWQDAIKKDPYFAESETPFFIGKAVVALASDPDVKQKSGKSFATWDLAKEYEFNDVDGRRPDMGGVLTEKSKQKWDDLVREIKKSVDSINFDGPLKTDYDNLEITAVLDQGSGKTFRWPVPLTDIWFKKPDTIAKEFTEQLNEYMSKK